MDITDSDKEAFVASNMLEGCEGWDRKGGLGWDHRKSPEYQATLTFIYKEPSEVKAQLVFKK